MVAFFVRRGVEIRGMEEWIARWVLGALRGFKSSVAKLPRFAKI